MFIAFVHSISPAPPQPPEPFSILHSIGKYSENGMSNYKRETSTHSISMATVYQF